MKELGFPEGVELMGVSTTPRGCAISIDFERHEGLESFVDRRASAGLEPRRHHTRACDGLPKEIELLLAVGETVEHDTPQQSYCDRLDEMRLMPFKGEPIVDEVYNGLRRQGKQAVACLLGRVTDPQLMPDPRKAPFWGTFAVGDAAFMVLTDICDNSWEDVLPAELLPAWSERGVYAYFEFVGQGVDNRQKIADAFEAHRCD